MVPVQLRWGTRALLTVSKLNLPDSRSGHQRMSLKYSQFNQKFYLIVTTKTFLLKILDAEILFAKSFISLCVSVCVHVYIYPSTVEATWTYLSVRV